MDDDTKSENQQPEMPEEVEPATAPYMPMCGFTSNDGVECDRDATRKFVARDEDGDTYVEYRCDEDDHTETDPEYVEVEL